MFESLLDTAYPAQAVDFARIERALLPLLERLATRRRPRLAPNTSERIDVRRTVREYVRRGEFVAEPFFVGKERQKTLAVLLDASESFRPFALWGAAIAVAVRRILPDAAVWRFGNRLEPMDRETVGVRRAYASLTGDGSRPTNWLSIADLSTLLREIARTLPGALHMEVWVISDLLIPPGRALPAALPSAVHAARMFKRVRVLDPTTSYAPYEDEAGEVVVRGSDLKTPYWRDLLVEDRTVRMAEGAAEFLLDARTTALWAERLGSRPVLTARRATPLVPSWGMELLTRRKGTSVLAELFFGE